MGTFSEDIDRYIGRYSRVLDSINRREIWGASNLLLEALSKESKVFILSDDATIAEHIDLILSSCRFGRTDKKFNCQSLCQNVGCLTDITANNYDNVFSSQLDGITDKDDLIMIISFNPNNKSVVKAEEYAKICKCKILSMNDGSNEKLIRLSDVSIIISDNNTGCLYSASLAIVHTISNILNNYLI